MTVGYLGRKLRELEDRLTEYEAKGERQDGATFSDEQVKRLKEIFDERIEVHAGRAFFRLILWVGCSAAIGAGSVVLAYFKLKG